MTAQLESARASEIVVQYRLRRDEVWNEYWIAWRRGNWRYWQLVVVAVLGATFLKQMSDGSLDPQGFADAALVVAVLFIGLALYPMLAFKPERRVVKLTGERIETTIGAKTVRRSWKDVASVRDAGTCIAIMARGSALLVPNRAFKDVSARMEFLRCAQHWHQARGLRADG